MFVMTFTNSRARILRTVISWIWLFLPLVLSTRFRIGTQRERDQPAITAPRQRLPPGPPGFDGFDPSAQILCVGKLPPEIPIPQAMVVPNTAQHRSLYNQYRSVRALCARPVYGGSITAITAGGYCAASVTPPTVVFQSLPPGGVYMAEDMKRIFLLCQQRCRCVTGDFASLLGQGRPATQIIEEEVVTWSDLISNPDAHRVSDPLPNRAMLYSHYPPPSWGSPIPVFFIEERAGRNLGSVVNSAAVTTVWIPPFDGYSSPRCVGTFDDPLSIPGGPPSASAQEICAASWYGGSKRGNLGQVCRRVMEQSGVSVTTEKSLQHPVYDNLYLNSQLMHNYQRAMRNCFFACSCPPPEDIAEPFEHKTTISTMLGSLYDASKTLVKDLQQGGRGSDALNSASGFGLGGFEHGVFALGEICRASSVDGFDLEGSLAKQALCRQRIRAYRRRKRRRG